MLPEVSLEAVQNAVRLLCAQGFFDHFAAEPAKVIAAGADLNLSEAEMKVAINYYIAETGRLLEQMRLDDAQAEAASARRQARLTRLKAGVNSLSRYPNT